MAEQRAPLSKQVIRMGINLLTCAGAGVASVALFLGFYGHVRWGWFLLVVSLLIDSVDGTLVRNLNVTSVCPRFDGERLDEYADLLTFVIAPTGLAVATEILPLNLIGLITAGTVIGGSCLQFAYERAKTEAVFRGFPSYWNVVYFYAWALHLPATITIGLSWLLVGALFLPVPFIYPSRTATLQWTTNILTVLWGIALLAYLWNPGLTTVIYGSLLFPVYYVVASFIRSIEP